MTSYSLLIRVLSSVFGLPSPYRADRRGSCAIISIVTVECSPTSSYSSLHSLTSLALPFQGLILYLISYKPLDCALYSLHLIGCICFLYYYNRLINSLFRVFFSFAKLGSFVIVSAPAQSARSLISSYLILYTLITLQCFITNLGLDSIIFFGLSSLTLRYFFYFLHLVCCVSGLYYYIVKDRRLLNVLFVVGLLQERFVILTPNALDQSVSNQGARNYILDLTFNIRIVFTIRFHPVISRKSHSSKCLVSLLPTATDQSASNPRAANYNLHLLSNQLDSTQPPASSDLRVDVVPISNSSEAHEISGGENQFATNSSELHTNQLNPQPPGWAGLPGDLFTKIAGRFTADEDYLSLKNVCHWWRFYCSHVNWTTNHQIPWLMLSEKQDSIVRSFYNFDQNEHYELDVRAVHGRRCFPSPHGKIATLTPHGKIHMLNPLSNDWKVLPRLRPSNERPSARDWFHFIHKLMVFKRFPNDFFVMAIYGSRNQLAFVRLGEREWNTIREADNIRDVALFEGQFYAFRDSGTLVRIIFRGHNVATTVFIATGPKFSRIRPAVQIYLVTSWVKSSSRVFSGDLLGVFRYGNVFDGGQETRYFKVYKFNFCEHKWKRLKDLGDHAIFVGEGNSWSISVSNSIRARSNMIYYTDDYWRRLRESTDSSLDIGLFSARDLIHIDAGEWTSTSSDSGEVTDSDSGRVRDSDPEEVADNDVGEVTDSDEEEVIDNEEEAIYGHDIGVFSMESKRMELTRELLNFGEDIPCEYSRPIWYTPNLGSKSFLTDYQ